MSYVRAEEPPGSGNWYDYEVAWVREDGRPRQKHIQYLGEHGGTLKPLIGDARLVKHRVSAGATNPDTTTPAPEPAIRKADPGSRQHPTHTGYE